MPLHISNYIGLCAELIFEGGLYMPVSKPRKKRVKKKRVYLKCRLCGQTFGLSAAGYCATCKEIIAYGEKLKL